MRAVLISRDARVLSDSGLGTPLLEKIGRLTTRMSVDRQ